MTRRILIHENATIDIHEHFAYLAESNQDQAFRFFDAARQTFAALARMPGMGQVYDSEEDDIIQYPQVVGQKLQEISDFLPLQ